MADHDEIYGKERAARLEGMLRELAARLRELDEAGRLLDLPVYDHVIVAGDRFVSFASTGLL